MENYDVVFVCERFFCHRGYDEFRLGVGFDAQGVEYCEKVIYFVTVVAMLDCQIVAATAVLACGFEARCELCAGHQAVEGGQPLPRRKVQQHVEAFGANRPYAFQNVG